ncbi:HlyD family secretion protein [Rhodoplanes sp. Z2-YC6860]|uniref:HlyD family secretion protein n=1 Tax=Rhodoplanes sp. Z2-YC6860 TaxID=674703 RepID=UPI000833BC09|nr:HlyD family secretion protein [Rhodoplanes sp. Z2-YC6860]
MLQRKSREASSLSVVPADGQLAELKGPSPEAAPQADTTPTEAKAASGIKAKRKLLLGGAAALALAAAAWFGTNYVTVGRFQVSTDDAYVRANNTTLGAKVSGYVSELAFDDNTPVRAGEVIARIDDGDYKLAVDSARDKVTTQQATVERFDRQITAQQAVVEQARAQLVSAKAAQVRMQSEYERQQALNGKDFASKQTLEQAIANRDQAVASVKSADAAIEGAVANVAVLEAQKREASGTLAELKTALAKAERDLSFTEIKAPVDGVIGNRAVQPGDFVQTGQRIAALVPLSDVYIDANFKETQLGRLRPGQPVSIKVDALPGQKIEGVVQSVAPASGAVFSLLPPDNATGNFTKIVQRVPVRVRVPAAVAGRNELRPGMSVIVDINTKPGAVASLAPQTRTATN